MHAAVQINSGDSNSAEARALIAELDAYLEALYPPEHNHLESPEALSQEIFLIASHDGEAVGCVAVKRLGDGQGEIKRLYVRPSTRGLGAAKKLMDAVETQAKSSGMDLLLLETGAKQVEACRLYERLGYQPRGPFAGYPDNGASLFMEKQL